MEIESLILEQFRFINNSLENLKNEINQIKQKTEKLTIKERPTRSEKTDELFTALAKVKEELKSVNTNSKINFVTKNGKMMTSTYADLSAIADYCNPVLGKHGVSFNQQIELNDHYGCHILIGILSHSSGQYIESRVKIIVSQQPKDANAAAEANPAQRNPETWGFKGFVTYMTRTLFLAMLGLGEDDDDGASYDKSKHGNDNYVTQTINKLEFDTIESLLLDYKPLRELILKTLNITTFLNLPKKEYDRAMKYAKDQIQIMKERNIKNIVE